MQNLKARAWLINEKRMVVVTELQFSPSGNSVRCLDKYCHVIYYHNYVIPEFILMLAVGWQDRIGVDAYDGDIVRMQTTYLEWDSYAKIQIRKHGEATGVIVYRPQEMKYQIDVIAGGDRAFEDEMGTRWIPEELQIIGNRHENLEMMKEYSDEKS